MLSISLKEHYCSTSVYSVERLLQGQRYSFPHCCNHNSFPKPRRAHSICLTLTRKGSRMNNRIDQWKAGTLSPGNWRSSSASQPFGSVIDFRRPQNTTLKPADLANTFISVIFSQRKELDRACAAWDRGEPVAGRCRTGVNFVNHALPRRRSALAEPKGKNTDLIGSAKAEQRAQPAMLVRLQLDLSLGKIMEHVPLL